MLQTKRDGVEESSFSYVGARIANNSCPVVSISSGKGGVGKTVAVANMAMVLAKKGLKVLIFDGDLGMANIDVILGLNPKYSLQDVLAGKVSIREILLEGPYGIKILPSGSGVKKLQDLSFLEKEYLLEQTKGLEKFFDIIIIDTGAGIGSNVSSFNQVANKNIILTTPEPHALTDAYALIKVLSQEQNKRNFDIIINMAKNKEEAERIAENIKKVASRYLDVELNLLGYVPYDKDIVNAIMRREAISEKNMHMIAGQAWKNITNQLVHEIYHNPNIHKKTSVWEQLFLA